MSYQFASSTDDGYDLHNISNWPARNSFEGDISYRGTPAASIAPLGPARQGYRQVAEGDGQTTSRGGVIADINMASNTRWSRRRIWLWEICSCVVSIGCGIGLVAILITIDHRTLPSWPLGITPNALVSVLAVFSKAATIVVVASCISQLKWHYFATARNLQDFETFDEASRGPIGSIVLLFRTRISHLASLGAALTILAVGVDPFLQQILSYEQHPVLVTNNTHAYRAQAYDSGVLYNPGGLQLGPEFSMKAAIYLGLFGNPDITGPVPVCSTGNCTMKPFTSLAVCSTCVNVTDRTTVRSSTNSGAPKGGYVTYNITYALPGNVLMNITYQEYVFSDEPSLGHGSAMTSRTDHSNDMTQAMFNVSSPITALSVLQFPTVNAAGYEGNYSTSKPLAWECALYFCVNTYVVNVTLGVPSTTLMSSWHDAAAPPIDLKAQGDTTLDFPPSLIPVNGSTTSVNNSFSVAADTLFTISSYLNTTLAGDVQLDTALVSYNTYANDVLSVLNLTTDLSSLFHNVSTAMTNYLRSGAPLDPVFSYASGSAFTDQNLVHVRWGWIVLPASIVLLATGFLGATIAISGAEEVWKASSLAVMFRGIEGKGEDFSEMRKGAVRRKVVLGCDSDGRWRLVPAAAADDSTSPTLAP